jgi:thiol-disulfide isomerase/thioredoxin
MTQSIAGQPAPELAVPYWIDAEGKERPPLTLKELGARHRVLFFYQHWCGGCHSHGFPVLEGLVRNPHAKNVGIAAVQTAFEGASSIRATSYPWTSSATASEFRSGTRAVRRSASIPPRWKTTARAAHRGS